MTRREVGHIDEPMRGAAARRVRKLERSGALRGIPARVKIVTLLGRPCRRGSVEDFTCDRCRRHQPDGLNVGTYFYRSTFALGFGLCDECLKAEVP